MTDGLGGCSPVEPVTGWKVGIVWWTGDGLCLSGVGGPPRGAAADRRYAVDDVARCARRAPHRAPDADCTCGFWSVAQREELGQAFDRIAVTWADLEVESFGTLVVHERGVRSERQRVLAVWLDDRCVECGRAPVRIGADKPGPATPRCRLHLPAPSTGWSATPADAAAELGTEVRFARRSWNASGVRSVEGAARSARWHRRAWVLTAVAVAVGTVIAGAAIVDDDPSSPARRPSTPPVEAPRQPAPSWWA